MSRNNIYDLNFYLTYMRKENNNPFEILDNDEMRSTFSPFILNRFFSFSRNRKIQFISQLLNRYVFSFYYQPEINFALMYLLIPKGDFERLPYIKATKKKLHKYDDEVYEIFRKAFKGEHLTINEITHYIDYLLETNPQFLVRVFLKAGCSKQEIRRWFPNLKDIIMNVKESKLTKKQIKDIIKKIQDTQPPKLHDEVEELL